MHLVDRLLELRPECARARKLLVHRVASLVHGAAVVAKGKLPRSGIGAGLVEAALWAIGCASDWLHCSLPDQRATDPERQHTRHCGD